MSSEKPKLYCAWFCPFAQRAWIALEHKGVKFDYVEQSPYEKTPEWLAINPRGLVPTITYRGERVYESSICIEFVDEMWPEEPRLMPSDPLQRAHVRIWADFVSKKIVPLYYRYMMREKAEEREQTRELYLSNLLELTAAKSKSGPFFMGQHLGLVDIMLVPYTIRWDVMTHFHGFQLPDSDEYAEVKQWHRNMIQVEGVKKTIQPQDALRASYSRYADGSAKTEVADAIRQGTNLP